MKSRKQLLLVGITVGLLSSVFMFQNCSMDMQLKRSLQSATGSSLGTGTLSANDFFKEPRPPVICGKEGYVFLHRNYFYPKCVSCHEENGAFPPAFAATNTDVAFLAQQGITDAQFIATTTANQFCGAGCSISKDGEVYKGLVEWLQNRNSCPPQ